jgi:citrate synthase
MQSSNGRELLSAREAAGRLGIKTDTLYAYVSRGLLRSVAVPESRERRYRPEDVERLRAGRDSGRGTRSEPLTPVIDSSICLIESGRFYYRGQDAARLAETATLEDIAELLWGAEGPHPAASETLYRSAGEGARGRRPRAREAKVRYGLIERCQVRLAELAAADLAALDLTRPGIVRTGWAILGEMVACVGERGRGSGAAHSRLAAAWRLDETGADLLRRCLVLLADHELNASTFVARCVASTAATPYAVVSGALSALSGRRHGGASARAEALLHEIRREGEPMRVMAARLARDERLPGLGHPLYPEGDPRARALLAIAAAALQAQRAWIEDTAAAAYRLTGQPPNVDFALATATTALGLPAGAALGLFIVGRTVGWIAHAIEQYETDVLIRPRARYTGPRPTGF